MQHNKNVVCSAADAECGALFHNFQKSIILRRTLESLGHYQNITEVITDNKTANSFVTNTMKMKNRKHGIWDRIGFVKKSKENDSNQMGKRRIQ